VNGNTEEIKKALIEAGDSGLSLLEVSERLPGRSKSSVSTLMKNWMESGHVVRSGKWGSYRYYHTGKEFSPPFRSGQRCQPTDSYERIYEAISGLYGAWFSSGSLGEQLRIEQSLVCNCLAGLYQRERVLERRGEIRAYEYRQIAPMPPSRFPKGEIPDLFFLVLQEAKRPLSVDSASLMVEKQRSLARKNGHPHWRYRNAVRKVAEGWARHGYLIVTHEDEVAHYELRDGITERPLSLAR
jgi:hypothetical protein